MSKIDELMALAMHLACSHETMVEQAAQNLREALEAALVQGAPVAWGLISNGNLTAFEATQEAAIAHAAVVNGVDDSMKLVAQAIYTEPSSDICFGDNWKHASLEDGDDVVLRVLAKAYRFAATGVGQNVGQYRGLIDSAINAAQSPPPRLTDADIKQIVKSLGWLTADVDILRDADEVARAAETAVRKQFGVSDD